MKQKTLISFAIGIIMLSYLIYQIWDITQNSKKKREFKPNYLRGLISHSEVLSSLDSPSSYQIANCFYENFIQKYGRDKLNEIDNSYAEGDTSVYRVFVRPILDSCILPFKDKIRDARYFNDCMHSFSTNKHSIEQKKAFCNCFIEKEKSKYGNYFEDSLIGDSMNKAEVFESGCGVELNK